ncbi:acid protease [Hymenopellis radicata]|nr:acid protease [Hymenopellis radicata]
MMRSMFLPLLFVLGATAARTWISLPMNVIPNMTDIEPFYSHVDVLFGTPPQTVKPVINLSGSMLAAWSTDCVFCAGEDLFDSEDSTSLKPGGGPWPLGTPDFNGDYVNDTVSFGGVLNSEGQKFVLMETMSANFPTRMEDGHLGLWVNASSPIDNSVFKRLWASDDLLNPVIGMRFDPRSPAITIGALDETAYEGTINWVQLEDPTTNYTNAIKIDGVKGYNGSFLPFGDGLIASLNSIYRNIAVPPSNPYALDANYTGPIELINLYPDGGFGFTCGSYVPLTVTINGVDYQVESSDMLHPISLMSATGICNVALKNTTADVKPDVVLGQPFLRSVYIAYRFPTDDCPGFYGFAFPSGANRTQAQISQQPASTPSLASQCLSLTKPTSTPTPKAQIQTSVKVGSYEVWGQSDEKVQLLDAGSLDQAVWVSPTGT